ncbi:MAG: protein-L-isoaspartate(D-aspartate) O-methyltransferase [Candidatus Omnitrophica bacterium]|nr:protein-L-isoaspartate(D-aspartate) O-methyltransferase [Candidatus Omnitrophota bacterium]
MGPDFEKMRNAMVDEQLIGRGISDKRVLEAFRKVPRHEFIPAEDREHAYSDFPLPIGNGQTISQPYMAALMTECLGLKGDEKVLEIGTGSGYQAAILAELAHEVYSIERIEALTSSAGKVLENLGYRNIAITVGDGTLGLEEKAPYDGIIVTAGAPAIPDAVIGQLNDRGRLVIPVGGSFNQILTIVEKRGDSVNVKEICGCVFVPLIGDKGCRTRRQDEGH